ncbi:N-formylglutamate amidohydrolase [Roseibium sp. RKSG952]|uniref:N-formylglutamate amidohydrolase n=1 Tax=Roseibium sp. RKSG952 TaxID=2529384 RepID=UPI0012BCCE09|nr:N-formylglutamate amidohydrolase [Roseibium sp. RKSG952]MTH97005.1 formiminoglutamase [Roseibium sp. RKSG952]
MILLATGNSPLIFCLPHTGREIPPAIWGRLSATGRLQTDLSWHLDQVLECAKTLDATVISTNMSRYVIDVDQDPAQMSPAAKGETDALCPAWTVETNAIYKAGEEPGPTEIEQRAMLFHEPYHQVVLQQIERVRARHGKALVFDCQSRRSRSGRGLAPPLPVISIGTRGGLSCDPDLRAVFGETFSGLGGFSVSLDDGVTGGYLTRTYGDPANGVHALTLLVAQRSYLKHEAPPFEPDKTRMMRLRAVLLDSFVEVLDWAGWSDVSAVRDRIRTSRMPGEWGRTILAEALHPKPLQKPAAFHTGILPAATGKSADNKPEAPAGSGTTFREVAE